MALSAKYQLKWSPSVEIVLGQIKAEKMPNR